jgi:RNA polymerase sigma factor (sigma-70 family)
METRVEPEKTPSFHDRFVELFEAHFHRMYRYLNRLAGDAELAADLAQETFVRLYRRGGLPDDPEAWLISVGTNLLRNAKSTSTRRLRLLTPSRAEGLLSDPAASPDEEVEAGDSRQRVRAALDRMTDRERRMLLLHAEGYRYKEIAAALGIRETSVGVLLARARAAFRERYEELPDAP